MPLMSMTGFSRSTGTAVGYRWNWEIKTVNNKGLDIRVKIPGFLDGFDLTLKKIASSVLSRGSVFVTLSMEAETDNEIFTINEDRLASLLDLARKHAKDKGVKPARIDGLMAIKGVIELVPREITETDRVTLEQELQQSFQGLLHDLVENRASEGSRMETVLMAQLESILALSAAAREQTGNRLDTMHERFRLQVGRLLQADTALTEERMAQELAIIAVKADIQEELDRLDSHIKEATNLIQSRKPVGRRLDFLCQEFNREANTLCSKSGDTGLTSIGIELKTVIDQFREQVQNIE